MWKLKIPTKIATITHAFSTYCAAALGKKMSTFESKNGITSSAQWDFIIALIKTKKLSNLKVCLTIQIEIEIIQTDRKFLF